MKPRLVLTALAVLAATVLPTAASAGQDQWQDLRIPELSPASR